MKGLLDAGLEDKLPGLMSPDHSSQARVLLVVATCRRIAGLGGPSDTGAQKLPAFAFVWTLQFRDHERPYRHATDHLVREIQSAGSPATALRLSWRREMDAPGGSVTGPSRIAAPGAEVAGAPQEIVPIDADHAGVLRALDAEAARVATERINEALAARRAWDEGWPARGGAPT